MIGETLGARSWSSSVPGWAAVAAVADPGRTGSWRRWLLGLLAALAVTAPAWLPWTDPHLNLLWEEAKGVDDAKNHMLRLFLVGWMVRHGVWYPRWLPDLFMGYGYPLFNFYAPGFYYLALGLRLVFRLDVWDGYRAGGVVAALLGAAGAYAFATAVWRRAALGVLAAVTLLYGPYVFQTNLFQRGDVPEALGLALLPWLLLAIWRLWLAGAPASHGRTSVAAWLLAAVAAGAAELLVHNLTAIMAAVVAGAWTAYLALAVPGEWRRIWRVVLAGVLAAGASAFFWLPAAGESPAVQLEIAREGAFDYHHWLLDLGGNTPLQQAPNNRQTRAGPIDLHLHYPHQHEFVVTLKPSLAQAALLAIAIAGLAGLGAGAVRRRHPGATGRAATPQQGASPLARTSPLELPMARRAGGAAVLPFVLLAIACSFLTLTLATPIWERLPGMDMLQYPGRLMGPFGVCAALAGAGGLASLLDALERRGPRGYVAAWGALALAFGLVLFNSLGDREVPLYSQPRKPMDGRMLVLEEGDRFSNIGTTSGGEFTPRDVQIATYTAGQRRGRSVFERLFPERDWAGDLFYPLGGDLRLLGWRAGPLRLSLRVADDAAGTGQVGIRQLRFPGWRAWLDGKRVPVGVAPYVPEQQAALGFVVVDVPPGEHTITLAFGPSTLRLAGMGLTLATVAGTAGGLALLCWKQRRAGGPLIVAACALVVLGAGYLTWRGVRPAFGRFAVPPAPLAQPRDGVWRAAGLPGTMGGLVVNLAEAVRTGQAQVASPDGGILGKDHFVDVRQLTVTDEDRERGLAATSRREWLYLHPPSSVSVDVAVPAQRTTWFQAALALDPAVWDAPEGDGVRYEATIAPVAAGAPGTPVSVLDVALNPRADHAQRRWVPVEVDLSPWAGQTVRLTLRTSPRDNLSFDWAGWGNPVVVVREFARERAPAMPS